ncbi:MAG: GNAT family N-acetyltransferase [Sandaracinaceae bacterium]|nr:GNAT family N-acetyltransferase [Sandaracinaceae bacterium]
MEPKRPPYIVHWQEIQDADDSCYPGSSELLSIGSALGRHTGLTQLGVHHELLPPGRRTSWPHAEADEDELVYVLEGYPHVWIDGVLHALRPGDAVGFPCGTGVAHTFVNDGEHAVRLLCVGLASAKGHRVHYPLHPARNAEIGQAWWADVPARALGPHDGAPRGPASPARGETPPLERRLEVPVIETERLVLRPYEERDAPSFFAMRTREGALDHMLVHAPASPEALGPMLRRVVAQNGWVHLAWIVEERERRAFVGAFGLIRFEAPGLWRGERGGRAELGVEIDRPFWGRGFVREAGAAVIDHAFRALGLHRLEVYTSPDNVRALRVAEALGFVREAHLRENARHADGRYRDTIVLARLAPRG